MADKKDDDRQPELGSKSVVPGTKTVNEPVGDKDAPPPAPTPKPVDSSPDRKPRDVGPPKGEDTAPVPAELVERIREAGTVEVVLSDGEKEITGIPPVVVTPDGDWRITGNGLILGQDVMVHGPAYGQAPYQIAGYGLFLDGKQVAYRARPDLVQVAPNMQVNLAQDIIF